MGNQSKLGDYKAGVQRCSVAAHFDWTGNRRAVSSGASDSFGGWGSVAVLFQKTVVNSRARRQEGIS